MTDLLFLVITAGFFAAASGLIVGCERLAAIDEADADLHVSGLPDQSVDVVSASDGAR